MKKSHPRIIMELHPGEEKVGEILKSLGYMVSKPSRNFIVAVQQKR